MYINIRYRQQDTGVTVLCASDTGSRAMILQFSGSMPQDYKVRSLNDDNKYNDNSKQEAAAQSTTAQPNNYFNAGSLQVYRSNKKVAPPYGQTSYCDVQLPLPLCLVTSLSHVRPMCCEDMYTADERTNWVMEENK